MANKRIVVNSQVCLGCGTCCAIVPQVFSLDEEGKVKVSDTTEFNPADVETAIAACPVGAISIVEE